MSRPRPPAPHRLLCPKLVVVKTEPNDVREITKHQIKEITKHQVREITKHSAKTTSRRILESCLISSKKVRGHLFSSTFPHFSIVQFKQFFNRLSLLTNMVIFLTPHLPQLTSGHLSLTPEEKRTLLSEGFPVPTRLPLSKAEERSLKKIRRKIKNKISAQESRRKKKEYLDALELRCEGAEEEKEQWRRRCDHLEQSNRELQKAVACLEARVVQPVLLEARMTQSVPLDIQVD